MYSFLSNFKSYLRAHEIPSTEDIASDYDILFANSWVVPYRTVREAKRRQPHLRVVHRIDGSARDYGRKDGADAVSASVNLLADVTIFQSRYSKHATTEKFKVIHSDGPVIYNAVDVDHFAPEGERATLPGRVKIACVTFSTNPRKGTSTVYRVAESNPDVDFFLIGRYDDPPVRPHLHPMGYLDRQALPKALRGCDVFLTFSENEACPNTVLEALATGLPVLYKDSGGTPELVGDCGAAVETDTFRKRLEEVLSHRASISRAARERATSLYSPDAVFPRYLAAMASARRRSIPGVFDRLRLRLKAYPKTLTPLRGRRPTLSSTSRVVDLSGRGSPLSSKRRGVG